MTTVTQPAAPPAAAAAAAAPPAEGDQAEGTPRDWGRVLDVAGVAAAAVLVVIVADIWTDGRVISRWLQRRPRDTGESEGVTGESGT